MEKPLSSSHPSMKQVKEKFNIPVVHLKPVSSLVELKIGNTTPTTPIPPSNYRPVQGKPPVPPKPLQFYSINTRK